MTNQYPHLSFNERAELCLGLRQGESLRSIARRIGRSASTLSRELQRNKSLRSYCPEDATFAYRCRRKACKPKNKIERDSDLKDTIIHMLKEYWSPQQIAGTLKDLFPNDCLAHVSHETIYRWIYAHLLAVVRENIQ